MCDLFQNVAEMEQSWISKRTRWAFQLEILPEAVNKGSQSYKKVLKLSPLRQNKFITYYNTLLFNHYDGSEDANLCCDIKCWHVSSVTFQNILKFCFSD